MKHPDFVFALGLFLIAVAGLSVAASVMVVSPLLFYLAFPLGALGFGAAAVGNAQAGAPTRIDHGPPEGIPFAADGRMQNGGLPPQMGTKSWRKARRKGGTDSTSSEGRQ